MIHHLNCYKDTRLNKNVSRMSCQCAARAIQVFVALGSFLLAVASVDAKWVKLSLEEVAQESGLIVVAVLNNVDKQQNKDSVRCKGTLLINETLKGSPTNSVLIKWEYRPSLSDPTDHAHLRGIDRKSVV